MSLRHVSFNSRLASGAIFTACLACVGVSSAQVFDAGGHANLLHQQELLRNQTTGDEDARRPVRPPGAQHGSASADRVQWHLKNLRPEYERRLRVNGKADADAWSARSLRGLLERDRRLGLESKKSR